LVAQALPEVFCEALVGQDTLKGNLDGFCLLLDQLDGVGKKHDLLAGSELAQIVVHRTNRNTGLPSAGGQVDDAVAVPGVLDESGLEGTQTDAVFLSFLGLGLLLPLFLHFLIKYHLILLLQVFCDVFFLLGITLLTDLLLLLRLVFLITEL
jgi:hypothetical protein